MNPFPNKEDVQALAALCKAAYAGHHDVESALAHVNISAFGSGTYIAFRGTANVRDWLTDVDAHKVTANTGAGRVHQGFYDSIRSVIDEVYARAAGTSNPIHITGHSLGGALAVLCGFYFTLHQIQFERLVTFGQPRVGDSTFAAFCQKSFGDRHTRVTNGSDLVPWVPWLMGTYVHSGNELYLPPNNGALFMWARSIENPSLIRKLLDNRPEIYFESRHRELAVLADHPIDRYMERLAIP